MRFLESGKKIIGVLVVLAIAQVIGAGSGALAVARATIPLVFYDNVEFAKATLRIALPLNLISAASPPILVGLLVNFGSNALLGFAILVRPLRC